MPRRINRKVALTTDERALRSGKQRAPRNQGWFDPFPWVHGTLPEKMVYAELSRRGIKFRFLNDIDFSIPEIDFNKQYQADFVLPDHKIIIEVQGAYWHSMAKTIEADAFKFAVYEITGYQVLAWWDYEIIDNLQELIASVPVLAGYNPSYGTASSELAVISRKKQDTSKGIRTLNQKRGQRNAYKRDAATIKTKKTAGRKNGSKTIFG